MRHEQIRQVLRHTIESQPPSRMSNRLSGRSTRTASSSAARMSARYSTVETAASRNSGYGDLASLPRAGVVVEDRYSQVFKLDRVRPAVVADGLAELAVRWPDVPVVFCETRSLAEEWTYGYFAAVHQWATTEDAAAARIGVPVAALPDAPAVERTAAANGPSTTEVRAWARADNVPVADRVRLPPEVWAAWRDAHDAH